MEDRELRELEFRLSEASKDAIELLLDEAEDAEIFEEVFDANISNPEILKMLYDHPDTPYDLIREIARMLNLPTKDALAVIDTQKKEKEKKVYESKPVREEKLVNKIRRLSVGEKIHLALRANKEVRSLLLKESNKLVVLGVIGNPKMTVSEVEAVARSRNVPEEALRVVAKSREWMKDYAVLYNLVTNPKTPLGVAMNFLPQMKPKDLALLEKNKNVTEPLRTVAKRLTAQKKKSR